MEQEDKQVNAMKVRGTTDVWGGSFAEFHNRFVMIGKM